MHMPTAVAQLQETHFIGVKTLIQLSRRFLPGAALWVPVRT